jgi:hypothetical protein
MHGLPLFQEIKLSLTGCSPAEPVSVLLDKAKVKRVQKNRKQSIKKQPTFCPLEHID